MKDETKKISFNDWNACFVNECYGNCRLLKHAPHTNNTAQFPADGSKYAILGRVKYEGEMPRQGAGYTKLLEVAKEKYPNADDVVNIVMDERFSYPAFYGVNPTTHIIISGIAIDYLEAK